MDKIADGFKGERAIVVPYSVRHFQSENNLQIRYSSHILVIIPMQNTILESDQKEH